MKKLIITIVVITAAALSFFVSDKLRQHDETGTITISIVDDIGDTISSEKYAFTNDDTLLDILEEHHTVSCASNDFKPVSCDTDIFMGHIVLGIDSMQTDWINTYIAIYINGEYSNRGVDDITLEDGNTYQFEYTEVGAD